MTGTTSRAVTLLAATITMGLAAGTFLLFQHTIMPGLRETNDRTFVDAFQHIDRSIENPWFMITAFLGALVFTLAATVANRGTPVMRWILVALVLYFSTVVITIAVNVPLNDAIKDAGDAGQIDVAGVRQQFDEAGWSAWNLVRTLFTTVAFGLLAWSLVLFGRTTPRAVDTTDEDPRGGRPTSGTATPQDHKPRPE